MLKPYAAIVVALVVFAPRTASATANYVYHEQTTNVTGGSCGPYLDTPSPGPTDTYPLRFKIEYQFYTDTVRIYYTTDGTMPAGAMGTATGTTRTVVAAYECTFTDPSGTGMLVDVAGGAIPAASAGSTVRYLVSAWHSLGGPEVFANSGTCGTCTACTTSDCATVFTYTIPGAPVDGGVDAGVDVVAADASSDASMDAGVDATSDGSAADVTVGDARDATATDAIAEHDGAPDAQLADVATADVSVDHTDVVHTDVAVVDTGFRPDANGGDAQGDAGFGTPSSGCTCRATSRGRDAPGACIALGLLAAALRGRRRRERERAATTLR